MKSLNWLVPAAIAALSATVTVYLQQGNLDRRIRTQTPESDRLWVEREGRKLKAMQKLPPRGFGFNNLIADYAFISFLQYYGDDVARVEHQTGYGLSKEYFKIIIPRKPYFFDSHSYMTSSISILAGEPQESIALMEQALEKLSPEKFYRTYSLWRWKAIDEMLFLGDAKKAQESMKKAKEAVERATFPPEMREEAELLKAIYQRSIEVLGTDFDGIRTKRMGWTLILSNASDERTRQIAVKELQKLGVGIEITPEGEIKTNSRN
jgi:tetratricopeptide (TPR) repeat protein